jgi:hypothetical protein
MFNFLKRKINLDSEEYRNVMKSLFDLTESIRVLDNKIKHLDAELLYTQDKLLKRFKVSRKELSKDDTEKYNNDDGFDMFRI